jgi:hypothetical protein
MKGYKGIIKMKAKTLNEAVYKTIHRSKKDLAEIADEIGVSANSLYRYSSPEGSSSYAEMPLRRLLPLLNSTNNDEILDFLEKKRGRIAFKVPNGAAVKLADSELVDHYQSATIEAVKTLRIFLTEPNDKNFNVVENALREVMKESAALNKYAAKKLAGQLELEL